MQHLEQLIANWRKTMTGGVGPHALDELESHLREAIQQRIRSGMSEAEAFLAAAAQIGSPREISSEFGKLKEPVWLPVRIAVGTGVALALWVGTRLAIVSGQGAADVLLGCHVLALTIGYLTSFLLGFLGICFVCQRCFKGFSSSQSESLARVTFRFGLAAASLTTLGILLGMLWARGQWGRLWNWDPKEAAALCVMVWLIFFIAIHRLRKISIRTVFLLSIIGNCVVAMAWFGAPFPRGLHSYGVPGFAAILYGVIGSHVAFFLVGLTSERRRPGQSALGLP